MSKWLSAESPEEQKQLLKVAREKSSVLKVKHKKAEQGVLKKFEERLKETNRKKREKEYAKLQTTQKTIENVRNVVLNG